jgi:hypothetical protein
LPRGWGHCREGGGIAARWGLAEQGHSWARQWYSIEAKTTGCGSGAKARLVVFAVKAEPMVECPHGAG